MANKLPRLVTREDLRGDSHTHSDWSDGHYTIEEMTREAIERASSTRS